MSECARLDIPNLRTRSLRGIFRNARVGLVHYDEPLSRHSSWKIGGPASLIVEPACLEDLVECCRLVVRHEVPCIVIGHGTNLLFDDAGLAGVVIKIARRMADWCFQDNHLCVQAGLWIPRLARIAVRLGLTGLEHIVGIPGTVGGLTAMNGGSLRRSIGDSIVLVRAVERNTGSIVELDHDGCGFAYRTSRFQQGYLVVAEVQLECEHGERRAIRREMLTILRERRHKFPRKQPNCGSVFVSAEEMHKRFGPPGKVIEEAGLKGCRIGAAQVSRKHANFIVNLGGASSHDVLGLIARIRAEVHRRTGIWMESEVRYVSPEGSICPASEATEQQ